MIITPLFFPADKKGDRPLNALTHTESNSNMDFLASFSKNELTVCNAHPIMIIGYYEVVDNYDNKRD